MGSRRMISQRIINSGKFLKMSPTARLLYYDMILRADDDGVVEAVLVMNITGAKVEHLREIEDAGLIKILNDDFASYIIDWKEHNWIRRDRKTDSIYKDLLLKEVPDADLVVAVRKPSIKDIPDDSQLTDNCQTSDSQTVADGQSDDSQVSCPSKDKLSKVKSSQVKSSEDKITLFSSLKRESKREDEGEIDQRRAETARSQAEKDTFEKPTAEEIQEYSAMIGAQIDADCFIDYYNANGWQIANSPMRDWRAAVRNWGRRENHFRRQAPNKQSDPKIDRLSGKPIDPQYLNDKWEVATLEASDGKQ